MLAVSPARRGRALLTLTLAAAVAVVACKKRDQLEPITKEELKAKDAPPPPPPPKKEAPPPSAKAWVAVPDLGVKVETPAGWSVNVPMPGHYTVKGASLADGFVQVNKADVLPADPDAAAAQRCVGQAKVVAKEKTATGAIFVVCETELQGNKSRSINAWLKKDGAPAAAHCTITSDRNLALLESVCRSLSPL